MHAVTIGQPEQTQGAEGDRLDLQDVADDVELELKATRFMRALTVFERELPEGYAWMGSTARVVVPVRGEGGQWTSGSTPKLPGMIFLSLLDTLQIIEGLVHEAAHNHLFIAEVSGLLVDPSHTEFHTSPLRSDLRPLRGVLLAYHALAYICAFYAEIMRRGVKIAGRERTYNAMREKLKEAEETVLSQEQHLTDEGRHFLQLTIQVGKYSDS